MVYRCRKCGKQYIRHWQDAHGIGHCIDRHCERGKPARIAQRTAFAVVLQPQDFADLGPPLGQATDQGLPAAGTSSAASGAPATAPQQPENPEAREEAIDPPAAGSELVMHDLSTLPWNVEAAGQGVGVAEPEEEPPTEQSSLER